MSLPVAAEPDKSIDSSHTPHLSHSRINRYLHCPEQYRLYYVEGLRARVPSASMVFGQVVHRSLARLFQDGADPDLTFLEEWAALEGAELTYAKRDSWEKFRDAGTGLLRKFVEEELPKIGTIDASENLFRLDVTSLEVPLVGVIDLVAEIEGKRTVIDFKTSGSSYQGHEAKMSDQLTAYEISDPEAEEAALWVLVRTKEPKIQWFPTRHEPEDFAAYLAKAQLVAREITAGRFYKRPGMWCGWCDYLPICMGEIAKADETLVKV